MNSLPIQPPPDGLDLIVDSDEPGDTTIRPVRPARLAALENEREAIRRWEEPRHQS